MPFMEKILNVASSDIVATLKTTAKTTVIV